MLKSILSFSVFALGVQLAAAQAAPAPKSGSGGAASLPEGAGKQILLKSCTSCHSVETITANRNTGDGWADVVSQMIGRGANISDDDAETLVEYLAKNYGPSSKSGSAKDGSTGAAQPAHPKTVNVNKAESGALVAILGVTNAEADAIVQYRTQHGDFKTWQEVAAVPGVNADTIKAHQDDLTF